ncbi:hypothetical protein D0T53_09150 [Dysgonomonas sp. 216]|nr:MULTISPECIES: hypothetical protein [unclassified Dysgonomonas]NDV67763.1 hypothetical protein [Dysgonomonas sp. 25]NDW19078.1 hypothetical protein [Dysgonomonas sp. 216]
MLMNDLVKAKFFSLLSETSQVTNKEMQKAYECFMEQLRTVSQSETDYFEIYRILSITRIELVSVRTHHRYGQGEKCA